MDPLIMNGLGSLAGQYIRKGSRVAWVGSVQTPWDELLWMESLESDIGNELTKRGYGIEKLDVSYPGWVWIPGISTVRSSTIDMQLILPVDFSDDQHVSQDLSGIVYQITGDVPTGVKFNVLQWATAGTPAPSPNNPSELPQMNAFCVERFGYKYKWNPNEGKCTADGDSSDYMDLLAKWLGVDTKTAVIIGAVGALLLIVAIKR